MASTMRAVRPSVLLSSWHVEM
uniref:Uncharacterized protein n=1 Tax=Arundo donax TaxID=35708 RepID=A0A0A8YED0_ARUDO